MALYERLRLDDSNVGKKFGLLNEFQCRENLRVEN